MILAFCSLMRELKGMINQPLKERRQNEEILMIVEDRPRGVRGPVSSDYSFLLTLRGKEKRNDKKYIWKEC